MDVQNQGHQHAERLGRITERLPGVRSTGRLRVAFKGGCEGSLRESPKNVTSIVRKLIRGPEVVLLCKRHHGKSKSRWCRP
eukprot:1368241-Alexandrium_andersonii.AAC.1